MRWLKSRYVGLKPPDTLCRITQLLFGTCECMSGNIQYRWIRKAGLIKVIHQHRRPTPDVDDGFISAQSGSIDKFQMIASVPSDTSLHPRRISLGRPVANAFVYQT